MAYGDLNKNREGLARLNESEWVRLLLDGGNWVLAKIKNLGQDGLDIEQYNRNTDTSEFEPCDAFLAYRAITGFVKISEAEAKSFLEKEPGVKRYLDDYVRLATSESTFFGRLTEVRSEGFMLSPYMCNRLEDDLLELCERGSLLIIGNDVKRIMPSSLEEIKTYIAKCNKKIEEAKKKEETKDEKK